MEQSTTTILSAADLSVDQTSDWVFVGHATTYCIHTTVAGSAPKGDLLVQCTNDATAQGAVTIDESKIRLTGDFAVNVHDAGYKYIRVFWDSTSGTGTLETSLVVKWVA